MTKQPVPRTYFSGCFKLTSGPPEAAGPEDEAGQLLELLREISQLRRSSFRLMDEAVRQYSVHELSAGDYILVRHSLERLEAENFKQQAAARRLLKRLLAAEAGEVML